MPNSIVLDAALQYATHGRSVLYIEPGTKYPRNIKGGWTQYQTTRATPRQLRAWFQGKQCGLCIVTGNVSGAIGDDGTVYGKEIADFDESGLYEEWCQEACRIGLGDLIARLPAEATPSGGAHIGYLCATIEGNQKLAMRDAMAAELAIDPQQKVKVRIETRGEGGLCIVAPTPPGIHPESPENGYVMIRGSWADVPIITPEERQQLFALSQSYQTSTIVPQEATTQANGTTARTPLQLVPLDPAKPGDDLNMRADRAWWKTLLEPHSWKHLHTRASDDVELWQRPGKDGPDASATLGATGNALYVFSTSAAPLEGQRAYSPFSAYIRLEHGGDEKAAAKALAALGYGTSKDEWKPNVVKMYNEPPRDPTEPPIDTPLDAKEFVTPLSDLRNAEEFAKQYQRDTRYCTPTSKWMEWTGTHWENDRIEHVMQLAKRTIRSMAEWIEYTEDDDQAKLIMKHIKSSMSANRLIAMLRLAQSEEGIPVVPEALDTNPWLLNCRNGTLDLKTSTIRPHQRDDYITHCLDVDYDPAATCPTWERFLLDIMGGNTELVTFLQRAIGYSMTGAIKEHVLFILHGAGENGKSTFINALLHLFGPYGMKAPKNLLMMAGNQERHPTELADLAGKRLVAAVETEEGQRLAEVLIKELTGGDIIRARRMREDFWEFSPTHTLWLATNHRPEIRGTDRGIWRRIRLIPFTQSFKDAAADVDLPDKLAAEKQGILTWTVQGCQEWQKNGLGMPNEVRAATEEYQAEMDVIGAFLSEVCIFMSQVQTKSSTLYHAYAEWCDKTGEHTVTQRRFSRYLLAQGYQTFRNNGTWYREIAINAATDRTDRTDTQSHINSSELPRVAVIRK